MDLKALSAPARRSEEADAHYARKPADKAKFDKRKNNGRKKGSVNKRTIEKLVLAEREVAAASKGKKFAVDHMDEMIVWFRSLVAVLVPFEKDGTLRPNRDPTLWFRAVDAFQGFLNMRAPYQSPRLSAVMVQPQAQQRTTVNVTILNEKGEKVYSDADPSVGDDAKLIEHEAGLATGEEAA